MNTFAFRFRQSRSCRWRFVSRKVCGVAHAVKSRWFDSENRVAGYALTNSLGRGVTATLAYDGSRMSGMTFVLPNGGTFSTALTRNAARPDLVTRRAYSANGSSIYSYDTTFDLLGRPVNATDSQSLVRSYLYNRRNELAAATIGTNAYEYAYDTIGNRTVASANSVTNTYAANNLNQYTQVDASQLTYDNDGNLTQDDRFAYTYDAENRLLSVRPILPTEGALAVVNAYDHKHRRVAKGVERFDGEAWQTLETHAFVYDGGNIVLEKIALSDGTTRIVEYFWGADRSGLEQGAGGVEGLLAVSCNGSFYFPCYGGNGDIVAYISEDGLIAAQYLYDAYGNVIESLGANADMFSFGFATKYHDREVSAISYLRRFYRPDYGRWLNRDPIEEAGGENLYAFCLNTPSCYVDVNGCWFLVDNAAAAILGALVGVAVQGVSDYVRGEVSDWESYLGAAAGGSVLGLALLHAPSASLGAKALYGGVSAGVANFTRQYCRMNFTKKTDKFDVEDFALNVSAGAVLTVVPCVRLPGVNAGRGSYLSVARMVNKKFANGTITSVSLRTTIKASLGTQKDFGVESGVLQGPLADGMKAAVDYVEVTYTEYFIFSATDKCGNEVEINYSGEYYSNGN